MGGDVKLRVQMNAWLKDDALPFWANQGLDRRHGGAVESFAMDGRNPSGVDFKRARVACRQIYVFSHAELLGWQGAKAAADHLYSHFVERFWQGPDKGWARRVTMEGVLLDPTPDLYDYAFALFALGWRYKARKETEALSLAHQTLDYMDRHFRHPDGEGFHAVLPPTLPREQNPHMHTIEAAVVLAEASSEARFRDLADEIAALFKRRICRLPEGVLPEFFDHAWRPVAGDKGRWIEPGHQFEWAWILSQHQKLTGADNAAVGQALVAWAERYGVDQAGQITFNGVRDDGAPLDRGSRCWPNTERMKGWIGLAELTGADPWPAVDGSARLLLNRYLGKAPKGCWIDQFDVAGNLKGEIIPTSTLYHVFLAFAEALRFAGEEL
jgi:mannose/cellobiose epimerase-like protein (N-acyl-D-glucosamine 2-epimerase family)